MRTLSIIIPVFGPFEAMEATLVSVLENRPEQCDILVVLNRPYNDPYALTDEVRFLEAPVESNWTDCVNLGIQQSRAPLLHILGSGVLVSAGWTDWAIRHFDDQRVGAVAPLVLDVDAPQRVVSAGLRCTRGGNVSLLAAGKTKRQAERWMHRTDGPSRLAGFYRRWALAQVGDRFDPLGGMYADADLALQLRCLGFRSVVETESIVLAAGTPPAKRGFRRAREAERLFLRHVPRGRWLGSLLPHAALVFGELVRNLTSIASITELAGRAAAMCELSRCRHLQRQLRARRDELWQPIPARSPEAASQSVPHTRRRSKRASA